MTASTWNAPHSRYSSDHKGSFRIIAHSLPETRCLRVEFQLGFVACVDGTEFWCELSTVRVDPTNTNPGYLLLATDVTQRLQSEEALSQSEARFRRIAESNIIGIMFSSVDGTVFDANDALLNMIGYSRQDLE